MLPRRESYGAVRDAFAWQIPERFNIGVAICDRWAETAPTSPAIIEVGRDGGVVRRSFGSLRSQSDRLANVLAGNGIGRGGEIGGRVGILLPQSFETAVAHVAVLKAGCISLPLFTLFGPDALSHRLRDSGAKAVVTNAEGARMLQELGPDLPELSTVLCVDGPKHGAVDYHAACATAPEAFAPAETGPDDPAILIYTSGTTGNPKGALHAHRVLLGHLPGVEMSHDFLPQDGDLMWTPADWAWIGGLLDVLMPALYHGVPVVAHRFPKFSAEAAFELIARHGIRNAFLPPTALKIMRSAPEAARPVAMRSVASGGETLGPELIEWGQRVLGTTINEFYGQTECNMIVSSCAALEPAAPGLMGRPVPGHRVEVVEPATGEVQPDGTEGEIAVLAPDPVMFLRYWNQPEATEAKFVPGPGGRWLLTGDVGVRSADGRLRFVGRGDDVISSAGYRIGPAEVEDCLIRHPAVAMAGVVGMPDALRGTVVAAYVTLAEGWSASDALADEISAFVAQRLAAHERPRVVRFLARMPMTTTGKIIRAELRAMAADEAAARG